MISYVYAIHSYVFQSQFPKNSATLASILHDVARNASARLPSSHTHAPSLARFMRHELPDLKGAPWTESEDDTLVRLQVRATRRLLARAPRLARSLVPRSTQSIPVVRSPARRLNTATAGRPSRTSSPAAPVSSARSGGGTRSTRRFARTSGPRTRTCWCAPRRSSRVDCGEIPRHNAPRGSRGPVARPPRRALIIASRPPSPSSRAASRSR